MKLIIAGSRNQRSLEQLEAAMKLNGYDPTNVDVVISGCARGADRLGEAWAKRHGVNVAQFPADWNGIHGKNAGFVRNEKMAEYGDELLAMWDGKSPGTKHMIDTMNRLCKPVKVFYLRSDPAWVKTRHKV